MKPTHVLLLTALLFTRIPVIAQNAQPVDYKDITSMDIRTGADQTEIYFPWLRQKRVAVVANQTSLIGKAHLVDSLLSAGIRVVKVFAPEHGFRGESEAGRKVNNQADARTGLPVISLYRKDKHPSSKELEDVDVVVFDIQDVGVRFYTYLSTMQFVMESCARYNRSFIVLDRPNPNGFYVDGPVMEPGCASFIGLNPVPLVHGLTAAEYACMINGEGWLGKDLKCDLRYVTVKNYNHSCLYRLPAAPSPNLQTMEAVYLYPSLGLFEGTVVSVGRGTGKPFEIIGHPDLQHADITFSPEVLPGKSTDPPFKGRTCHGYDLTDFARNFLKNYHEIYLFWLIETYRELPDKKDFFNSYFEKLAGTTMLREQIESGKDESEIRKSWAPGISKYKTMRKKYLLYPDFE